MTQRSSGPGRARRAALVVTTAGVLLAGCQQRRTTVSAFSQEAARVQASAPETRPWFCNAVGTGTPPGGHGNGSHVAPMYEGKSKGPLSWEDCTALAAQLDKLLTATQGLETRAKGEAAGWFPVAGDYIPGLGTHHGNFSGFTAATFDPAKPQFLIYGGRGGDAPLVGAAYTWIGKGVPPEGFAGGNDWWHEHNKICMGATGVLGGAEEIPDDQCTALGGRNIQITGPGGVFGDTGNYVLHLWLPPYEYRPDLFVSGQPCLLETGVARQDDPCWELAHRDPALGAAPGTPHDGGHEH